MQPQPPTPERPAHVPVLIGPLIRAVAPVAGHWLDGTFGAGGYSRALLEAGAARVTGVDRDPAAVASGAAMVAASGGRLDLVQGTFSALDTLVSEPLDGIVLDLGVSSMQIDQPERGFSFAKDGPLDMRMGSDGPSAPDLVNGAAEAELADILYHYGEERASRRIARAIVKARTEAPVTTTQRLSEIVCACLPRPKPGQSHAATRSFQAIRIAVNAEFTELAQGLAAAERALRPGGALAVVTFHSLEDRIVKRFFQTRSGADPNANRHAPATNHAAPRFTLLARRPVAPDAGEIAANPRARSAKLRVARRTDAPAGHAADAALGVPELPSASRKRT